MARQSLTSKVIVITGASSGFGKGSALEFAKHGAYLVLAARRDRLLDDLVEQCKAAGGRAVAKPTDVSDPGRVEELAETALNEFGRIDIWVNNAGAGALGPFDEVPLDDHIQVIKTDLLGTLYGSYFAIRQFKDQKEGILINIASVLGIVPTPHYASYAAAKHGVVGLSATLRQELKQENFEKIRVCTVLPTSTDTPFFEHAANYTGHQSSPIPPVYEPMDVVETIVRMATDPEDSVAVGAAAKAAIVAHHIAPGLTERMMSKKASQSEEKAPLAKPTGGAVKEPSPTGTEVGGGWKRKR